MSIISKFVGIASQLLDVDKRVDDEPIHQSTYRYLTLPSCHCIRLLEIYPGEGELQCSLHVADLDASPVYDALSYTWGDPRPPLYQSIGSHEWQKRRPVRCDGEIIYVTTNLFHGLQRLRGLRQGSSTTQTRYIWIDALCINQANSAERSAQVAMMDEIYTSARGVIAWLGKDDLHTEPAIRLINYLSSIPEGDCPRFRGLPLSQAHPGIPESDWKALVAFFRRSYFCRAWVVQELVLAPQIVLFCGTFTIMWQAIVNCLEYMSKTRSGKHLIDYICLFETLDDHVERGILPKLGAGIGIISGLRDNFSKGLLDASYIVMIGRGFNATDQRDHVYASFGLVKRALKANSIKSAGSLNLPDYSKSTREVFIACAELIFRHSENLLPLSFVEDRPDRGSSLLESLPSWVPDMSISIRPSPLCMVAMGGDSWRWNPSDEETKEVGVGVPVDGRLLVVRGAYFDTIISRSVELSELEYQFNWVDVLELLRPVWSLPLSSTTFVDALWRTLVADTEQPQGQRPASSWMGRAFAEMLASRIRLLGVAHFDLTSAKQYASVSKELMLYSQNAVEEDSANIQRSRLSENFRYPASAWANLGLVQGKRIKSQLNKREYNRDLAVRTEQTLIEMSHFDNSGVLLNADEIQQLVQVLKTPGNEKEVLLARIKAFQTSMKEVSQGRRVILTTGNFLGMGPRSTREGDQVWVLKGTNVPFVLRPLSDGQFSLVGEAYVHGIMYGEAAINGGLKYRDLELV